MNKSLMGKLLMFPLLLTISIFILPRNLCAEKIQLRVLVTKANIRLEPNTGSQIITAVPRGAVLEADERQGSWYRIYLPPDAAGVVVSGYIHSNLVEPLGVIAPEPQRETQRRETPKKTARIPAAQPVKTLTGRSSGFIAGYGIKSGLNLAKWYGEDATGDLQKRTGLMTGGFVTINIYRIIGFQPEILFTQKGTKITGFGGTAIAKTDYIEIPLLIKGSPPPLFAGLSPIFYIGPAFGINIRKQVVTTLGGMKDKSDIDNFKTLDIGLVYGSGIHYQFAGQGFFGKTKLILDIRYTLGLTTISDIPDDKVKNGVMSILFGLGF